MPKVNSFLIIITTFLFLSPLAYGQTKEANIDDLISFLENVQNNAWNLRRSLVEVNGKLAFRALDAVSDAEEAEYKSIRDAIERNIIGIDPLIDATGISALIPSLAQIQKQAERTGEFTVAQNNFINDREKGILGWLDRQLFGIDASMSRLKNNKGWGLVRGAEAASIKKKRDRLWEDRTTLLEKFAGGVQPPPPPVSPLSPQKPESAPPQQEERPPAQGPRPINPQPPLRPIAACSINIWKINLVVKDGRPYVLLVYLATKEKNGGEYLSAIGIGNLEGIVKETNEGYKIDPDAFADRVKKEMGPRYADCNISYSGVKDPCEDPVEAPIPPTEPIPDPMFGRLPRVPADQLFIPKSELPPLNILIDPEISGKLRKSAEDWAEELKKEHYEELLRDALQRKNK